MHAHDMNFSTGFQRSVALATLADRDASIFVEQFVLDCPATLEPEQIRDAWAAVLERHPGLSAQYDFAGARLVYRPLPLPLKPDEVEMVRVDTLEAAEAVCAAHYRPFSIGSDASLWRAAVISTPSARWFCITMHHLIFDDRSWRIIRTALADVLRGATTSSAPQKTFADYLTWRNEQITSDTTALHDRGMAQWNELTRGLEGPTVLPSLAAGPDVSDGNLRFAVQLGDTFLTGLDDLRREYGVTVNHVALAGWALVMGRLCRTDFVCFGQTRHGVPAGLADAAAIVGPMVDTVPFAVPLDDSVSLRDFLADVASRHRRMYSLQMIEVADLIAHSMLSGSDDVMSTVVNHVRSTESNKADSLDLPVVRQRKSAALQPTLTVIEGDQLTVEVVTSARHAEFGRVAADALGSVLSQIVERPKVLGDISTVDVRKPHDSELRGPLERFGARTLAELLTTSLRSNGDRLALDGAEQLTYADLDRASLYLARNSGLATRTDQACVAVIAAPGRLAVTAVAAIVRSGHCFICIDPARPVAEIRGLLDIVAPDLVVVGPGTDPTACDAWPQFSLDGSAPGTVEVAPSDPNAELRRTRPEDLAYLVATSGSTGVPKVVEIEQASAANAINALVATYGMTPHDRRLRSVSRPGADVFIAELLVPLCSGATLVEAIGDRPLAPAQFFALLDRESITIAGAASSYLAELVDARSHGSAAPPPRTLRLMTTGTEVVAAGMVNRWREAFGEHVTLLNVYGPAEATLVTTTCRLSALTTPVTGPLPIGLPLANTHVMLLDRAGQPVPRGAVGEICIAGAGVMRGYRGLESPTIVITGAGNAGDRYYRTGDLGRIGPDGQLVFCGRSDRQVKIRGHRVELDGVEARLRLITGIPTVAALAIERAGRLVLVAAIESDDAVDDDDVRSRMAAAGSPAEVPAAVVGLMRFPRLANGKLDRRSIAREIAESLSNAAPEEADANAGTSPQGAGAFGVPAMTALWNELFEVDDCNEDSDFFDLGGDSLLAVRLAAEVDHRFDLALDLDVLYRVRRLGPMVTAVTEQGDRSTSGVIRPLAARSGGARIYFMHGGAGLHRHWTAIADCLADDFDSWGIVGRVARGLPMLPTVAETCAEYVDALARHGDRERPFTIVGFSAAGVLAYETARLAAAAGLPVERVVLLETRPSPLPRLLRFIATAASIRRRGSTAHAFVWVARRALAIALRALRKRHRQHPAVPTSSAPPPSTLPFITLAVGHRPRPAHCEVVVIETLDPGLRLNLRVVWGFLARRRVRGTILDIDQHLDLVEDRYAPVVSDAIRAFALGDSRRRRRTPAQGRA